jgi:hypothetical protein
MLSATALTSALTRSNTIRLWLDTLWLECDTERAGYLGMQMSPIAYIGNGAMDTTLTRLRSLGSVLGGLTAMLHIQALLSSACYDLVPLSECDKLECLICRQ